MPHIGHLPYEYGLAPRWAAHSAPTSGGTPEARSSVTSAWESSSGRWLLCLAAVKVYVHGGRGSSARADALSNIWPP